MGHIDARLAELGITLPAVATPVAAYVPATISGNILFTAGQLPFVDGALLATGESGRRGFRLQGRGTRSGVRAERFGRCTQRAGLSR